uniref:Uncharacterized protein n=1 Tax=Setaria digitata TaxID=48799 RepID=A0A915PUS4_9BILA
MDQVRNSVNSTGNNIGGNLIQSRRDITVISPDSGVSIESEDEPPAMHSLTRARATTRNVERRQLLIRSLIPTTTYINNELSNIHRNTEDENKENINPALAERDADVAVSLSPNGVVLTQSRNATADETNTEQTILRAFVNTEPENHEGQERESSSPPVTIEGISPSPSSVISEPVRLPPVIWPEFWPPSGSHPIVETPTHSPVRRRRTTIMEEVEPVSVEDLPEVNAFGPNGTPPRTPSPQSFIEIHDSRNRNSREALNKQRRGNEHAVNGAVDIVTNFVTPPSRAPPSPRTPQKNKINRKFLITADSPSFFPKDTIHVEKLALSEKLKLFSSSVLSMVLRSAVKPRRSARIRRKPNRYKCDFYRGGRKDHNRSNKCFARSIRGFEPIAEKVKQIKNLMNSLISGPAFPFEFLHAEIIRYEKEREVEQNEKRKRWIEKMRDNPQLEDSLLDEQLKSVKEVFIQGNAETRLEALGYRVGFVLVEKIARDLPRMITELEKMKFLCKEFWTAAFGKQVDNLRTNHQVALHMIEGKQYVEESAVYLAFPCGIVRGALYNLGITSLVTSSVETLPAVKFHVHMQQKSSGRVLMLQILVLLLSFPLCNASFNEFWFYDEKQGEFKHTRKVIIEPEKHFVAECYMCPEINRTDCTFLPSERICFKPDIVYYAGHRCLMARVICHAAYLLIRGTNLKTRERILWDQRIPINKSKVYHHRWPVYGEARLARCNKHGYWQMSAGIPPYENVPVAVERLYCTV